MLKNSFTHALMVGIIGLLPFSGLRADPTQTLVKPMTTPAVPAPMAVAAPLVAPSPPALNPPPATKSAVPLEATSDTPAETKYRKKWAIIIGINYAKELRAKTPELGTLAALTNAENDAADFYQLLIDHYDYKPEEIVLLQGSNANNRDVNAALGKLKVDGTVKPEDSVLFYFSGHGHLSKSSQGETLRGSLLLSDCDMRTGGPTSGMINFNSLVEDLTSCPAKHRLLILDCCHSGSVFRLPLSYQNVENTPVVSDVRNKEFTQKSFHAITASRESEVASDGRGGHSPFTAALLESMKLIPRKEKLRNWYTADELFAQLNNSFDASLREKRQSPQYQRLTSDPEGRFHFFPNHVEKLTKSDLTEDDRKLLLAMVPSTFGNWWGDEIPWFMPSLREHILNKMEAKKSSIDAIDGDEILASAEHAAFDALKKAQSGSRAEIDAKWRFEIMNDLIQAKGRIARDAKIVKAIETLETATKDIDKCEPTDLHYLAVLLHKQGQDNNRAYLKYKSAICGYEKSKNRLRTMHSLCRLDFGIFLLNNPRELNAANAQMGYQEAANQFRTALELFHDSKDPQIVPKPFEMFVYAREADAYRRLNKIGMSDARFNNALSKALDWDAKKEHLLTAAMYKHRAWAFMDMWRFKKAGEEFRQANSILQSKANIIRKESIIDSMHVRHGLAMAERFQGRTDKSLELYRQLTQELSDTIRDLDREQQEIRQVDEIRELLHDRLVNSLERQADCNLFGDHPDYAEAADDYRRAVRGCENLPKDQKRERREQDLLYRWVIALTMPRTTSDGIPFVPDLELAMHLFEQADRLDFKGAEPTPQMGIVSGSMTTGLFPQSLKAIQSKSDMRTQLVRCLAKTLLLSVETRSEETLETDELRTLFEVLQKERQLGREFDRDELERLMFAYKLLIDHPTCIAVNRIQKLKYVNELLVLCRSAGDPNEPDPDLLRYLRPYYNTAFLAKKCLLPSQAKELVEIAWESTHGVPYTKRPQIDPLIVVYHTGVECYLILDTPGDKSRCFALKDAPSPKALSDASQGQALLPLPDEVRLALSQLQKPALLRWRDPVHELGYPAGGRSQQLVSKMPIKENSSDVGIGTNSQSRSINSEPVFPFNVQTILKHQAVDEKDFPSEKSNSKPGLLPPDSTKVIAEKKKLMQ